MAARWVDLLLRIHYTLDQADYDLSDADRAVFYTHVQGTAQRRAAQRRLLPCEHPLPSGEPLDARDPSGD